MRNGILRLQSGLALLLIALLGPAALAATVWVEGIDGDLSSDPMSPTAITFSAGINSVFGSVQSDSDTRDYFTFTIDPGFTLTGIFLRKYVDEDTGGPGNRGFHAISLGTEGVIPGPGTGDLLLGGDHLDPVPTNLNLLDVLAGAPLAGTGFDTPLGAGSYTYLIQQTGPQLTGYQLDFTVKPAPIPLPMAGWLFASGLLAFARLRRRQQG